MKWDDCFFWSRVTARHCSTPRYYFFYYWCCYYLYIILLFFFLLTNGVGILCFDMSTVPACNNKNSWNIIRLNKLISLKQNISRRKADTFIKEKNVKLNNIVITNPGTYVDLTKDCLAIMNKQIKINNVMQQILKNEPNYTKKNNLKYFKKWIALHKPKGYICTSNDERNRKNVFSLFPEELLQKYRLVSVGRLDRNTSGVLLLTNEYEWIHKLTHPKFGRTRTYRVCIEGRVNMRSLRTLANGVYLEEDNWKSPNPYEGRRGAKEKENKKEEINKKKGKRTLPAFIEILREENMTINGSTKKRTVLNISVREGKNRQIRKMFNQINQPVIKIKRIAFENITLKDIHFPKQYRELNQKEISDLKKGNVS